MIKIRFLLASCVLLLSAQVKAKERILTDHSAHSFLWKDIEKSGFKNEVTSMRSRYTKHFEMNNGSFRMYTSPGSMHYQSAGGWKEINLGIQANNTGIHTANPYCNNENCFQTYYPQNPVSGHVYTRMKEGEIAERIDAMYVTDGNGHIAYQYKTDVPKKALLNQTQISYPDLFPHTTACYSQQADGRKMNIILESKAALDGLPANAQFLVIKEKINIPADWTVTENEGYINLFSGGIWVANFLKPVAVETQNHTKEYMHEEDLMSEGSIRMTKNGCELTIYTTFPIAWLKKTNRQFPIYLDPTVNYYPPVPVLPTTPGTSSVTGRLTSPTSSKSVGFLRMAGTGTFSWAKFDISTLPLGTTITDATYYGYQYTPTGIASDKITSVVGMQSVDPETAINSVASPLLSNQINTNGPVYNSNYVFGGANPVSAPFTWRSASLSGNAASDITAQRLSQGWTALGFKFTSGNTATMLQNGIEITTSAPANLPYLTLNYSTNCTGTPAVATSTASVAMACGNPFSLGLAGNLSANTMYQWQTSPAGLNTWSNLGTSQTSPNYSTTQSSPTDYQCVVTCNNSGLSTTSTIVSVGQLTVANCYCIPNGPATSSTYITAFSTSGAFVDLNHTGTGYSLSPSPGYGNYTSMSVAQSLSGTFNFSVSFTGGSQLVNVWVDWNQDGDFNDVSENVSSSGTLLVGSPYMGSITVPAAALTGDTRMRVRILSGGVLAACGSSTTGETEDYTLTVLPSCTNTLLASIPLSAISLCSGNQLYLDATCAGPQSFQWKQSNTPGGPYINVVGGIAATSLQYSKTVTTPGVVYYVLETTCNSCAPCSALSNEVAVTTNPVSSSISNVNACNSYIWHGVTYATSGTYTYTNQNLFGCDSIETFNLTIHNSHHINVPVTACDSYTWSGNTYTVSGIYTATYLNIYGCDSIRQLHLIVNHSQSNASAITACDGYLFGALTYTMSGTYVQTFVNAAGCDSLHTLTLTIRNTSTAASSVTACNNYVFGGNTYTASGTYIVHFINAAGCDSSYTLNLTINTLITTFSNASGCNSYVWNGNTYTASGVYSATFNTPVCDSIHTLTLTLDRNATLEPRAFIPNTTSYNVSVVNLVTNTLMTTIPVGVSPSGIAFSPNKSKAYVTNTGSSSVSVILTATNSVITTIPLSLGPNSIVMSPDGSKIYVSHNTIPGKITVIDASTNTVITTITTANSLHGVCVSPDGTKLYTHTNTSGTVYTINTSTYAVSSFVIPSFSATNMTISPSGDKLYLIGSSNTVVSYNLITNIPTYIYLTFEGYQLSALALSPDGSKLFVGKGGANRVAVINTTTNTLVFTYNLINGFYIYGLSISADGNKLYLLGGGGLTTINMTTNTISSAVVLGGSPASITPFIGGGTAPPANQIACDMYIWNGTTYTTSGTYTTTATNMSGCDSLSTINLTVNHSSGAVTSSVTACDAYIFGGITYTVSGMYTASFPLPTACDSVHILYLTVLTATSSVENATACHNYIWHGSTYSAGGTYTKTFTNAVGCDSTVILHLNISDHGQKAYIPSQDSDSLSVIDLATNTVVYKMAAGDGPNGISVSPDGNRVYVSNGNSNTISVINTHTNSVVSTIPVAGSPKTLRCSPDGSKVYIAIPNSNSISVINTATNTISTSIPAVGSVLSMDFSADGTKLYAANGSTSIQVINMNSNTVSAPIPVSSGASAIATNPDGNFIYTLEYTSGQVTIINLTNQNASTIISTGFYSEGICCSPDGSKIYITKGNLGKIKVIGTSSKTIIDEIILGFNSYEIEADPNSGNLYVTNGSTNQVSVINATDHSILTTIPLSGQARASGNFITSGGYSTQFACNSGILNGQTYTASGIYTFTYTSTTGCDSVRHIHLIIRQSNAGSSSAGACNSYLWKGITYTTSGVYTRTFVNINFCDSVHTLSLTIHTANVLAPKAYVASRTSNSVVVINLKNNTVIKSILLMSPPVRTLVNLACSKVYVAYSSSAYISVINTATDSITADLPLSSTVYGLTLNRDGTKLYVLAGNAIRIINTSTNAISATIALPSTYKEIALSPDEAKIYLLNSTGNLLILNSAYSSIGSLTVGLSPLMMCMKPDGSKLYVANSGSNSVSVINTNTLSVEATVPVGAFPRSIAINNNGSAIYVSNRNSGNISVISTSSNLVTSTIPMTGNNSPAGLALSDDGNTLYVALPFSASGKVGIINTATNTLSDSITAGNTLTEFGNFIAGFATVENHTSCGSYTWNGLTYTASGIYTRVTNLSAGCDSISKLNLTINTTTTGTSNITACDAYTWNGNTYTTSGSYADHFMFGSCDSLHTLNLVVLHSSSTTSNASACNSYTWQGNTYTLSGVYTGTLANTQGCDSVVTLNLAITCYSTVYLKFFLQGYYSGSGHMVPVLYNQGSDTSLTVTDSVNVELHDPLNYSLVSSVKALLHTDGTLTSNFPSPTGTYYIAIRHRNGIETWSADPVLLSFNPVSYDFTTASYKAFQSNQVEVESGIWAFYTGDANQDENIDLFDTIILETDVFNFQSGYFSTDFNGDGNVDLLDAPLLEENVTAFIFSHHQ